MSDARRSFYGVNQLRSIFFHRVSDMLFKEINRQRGASELINLIAALIINVLEIFETLHISGKNFNRLFHFFRLNIDD